MMIKQLLDYDMLMLIVSGGIAGWLTVYLCAIHFGRWRNIIKKRASVSRNRLWLLLDKCSVFFEGLFMMVLLCGIPFVLDSMLKIKTYLISYLIFEGLGLLVFSKELKKRIDEKI